MTPVRLKLGELRRKFPELLEALRPHGRVEGEVLVVARELYTREMAARRPASQSLPRERWPAWAKGVSYFATAADTGVGDTVARVIGPFGGAAFKVWHQQWFHRPCQCAQRQADWNRRFPYQPNNSTPD